MDLYNLPFTGQRHVYTTWVHWYVVQVFFECSDLLGTIYAINHIVYTHWKLNCYSYHSSKVVGRVTLYLRQRTLGSAVLLHEQSSVTRLEWGVVALCKYLSLTVFCEHSCLSAVSHSQLLIFCT